MAHSSTITKNTLIPIGLVITLVIATWTLATERARVVDAVEHNAKVGATLNDRLKSVEQHVADIDNALADLVASATRVERKLQTLPHDGIRVRSKPKAGGG